MRKMISVFLILIIALSATAFAYADIELTENVAFGNELKVNDGIVQPRSGGSNRLTVPLYQQPQNSNQCGPTSCRMILAYFGVSKSLTEIKNEMANMADRDYTHIDSARTMLNRYISGNHYQKYSISTSTTSFSNNLMESIDAGYPVLCHLNTSALPAYNGMSYYHYVVATGYMWGQGGTSGGANVVYYNDPHYDSRFYGRFDCSWSQMQSAILNNAGLILRGV